MKKFAARGGQLGLRVAENVGLAFGLMTALRPMATSLSETQAFDLNPREAASLTPTGAGQALR